MGDTEKHVHASNDTVEDPGVGHASSRVKGDAAGKQTLPPANGARDEAAIAAGEERLEQAGAGH